jgi:hypothetical protein
MLGILNFSQSNAMLGVSEAYASSWDNSNGSSGSSTASELKWHNVHIPYERLEEDSLGKKYFVKTDSVRGYCHANPSGTYLHCHAHGPMKCNTLN